jgi:hypothetical protein
MLDLNLVSLSAEVTSKELLLDAHVRRLQEVIDKEPYDDDQATCAIIIGTRGHKNAKLDKLTVGQNRGRYRISYTLLLNFSLSSSFLSATAPTMNIDLL